MQRLALGFWMGQFVADPVNGRQPTRKPTSRLSVISVTPLQTPAGSVQVIGCTWWYPASFAGCVTASQFQLWGPCPLKGRHPGLVSWCGCASASYAMPTSPLPGCIAGLGTVTSQVWGLPPFLCNADCIIGYRESLWFGRYLCAIVTLFVGT